MKKMIKRLIIGLVVVVVSTATAYFVMAMYYKNSFLANTWINGVYCTGSSVKEVNTQLMEQTKLPDTLTVIGYSGTGEDCRTVSWTIPYEDFHYTIDYSSDLNKYINEQNAWVWFDRINSSNNHVAQPTVTFDEMTLLDMVDQITTNFDVEEEYVISYSAEDGYTLYDGMHNRVDEGKVLECVRVALLNRMETVDLIAGGCYYDLELDGEQAEAYDLWKKIDVYQQSGPVYNFGDENVKVTAGEMAGFLLSHTVTQMPFLDDNGCFILRDGFAKDWASETAKEHDTYGKTWEFTSTRGETLFIEGENYGTQMNQDREASWFETYMINLVQGKHAAGSVSEGTEENPRVPMYSKDAYSRSKELADTYIEVDFGIQTLYYYEKGELKLETEIVSGNMRRRWDTPQGVNYVYNKQKNRVLRGQGYATPVKFWMPVDGAIGIHDADWRNEFGGDEYKKNGSHGCVNVPKEVMPELYDMVEIGTPVIMFYGTDPETGKPIEWH